MTITDPKKSKSLVLIISLLIIITIVLITILVLKDYNKPKPVVVNNTNNSNQQANNNSQELKPIIPGWKVYENKEYGFRIDYPREWSIYEDKTEEGLDSIDFLPKDNRDNSIVGINFEFNFDNLSLEEMVKKYLGGGVFDNDTLKSEGILPKAYYDVITLDGEKVYKTAYFSDAYFIPMVYKDNPEYKKNPAPFFGECGCPSDGEGIIFQKNNKIIIIGAGYEMHESDTQNKLIVKNGRYEVESPDPVYNESKEIFAKMISSFRWIE